MAQRNANVLLGFQDEIISEKYENQVNFTTNKIGGKPIFPNNIKIDSPKCLLCQLTQPLVVQIYAPLENSSMHRALYLFGCINSNCWNRNESWTCLRMQCPYEKIVEDKPRPTIARTTDWCTSANDWDDEDNGNLTQEEEDDYESGSSEEIIRNGLAVLNVDDHNANNGAYGGPDCNFPIASAKIEGDEGDIITIDTPTMPQNNILSLLQENSALSVENLNNLQFIPSFINVTEEISQVSPISDQHVKELLSTYQKANSYDLQTNYKGEEHENYCEKYEKSYPAHKDKMFYHFLAKIQANPRQILRYNREGNPIVLYSLQTFSNICNYCKSELVFEFQLLSTIIPSLELIGDDKTSTRLEFGTILVFTCKNSCWENEHNAKFETVIIQNEMW